jgi:hypothetical protein
MNNEDYETLYRSTYHNTFGAMYTAISTSLYDHFSAQSFAYQADAEANAEAYDETYAAMYRLAVAEVDTDAELASVPCSDGLGWVAKDCSMVGDMPNWLCPGCDMLMPPRAIRAVRMRCPLCKEPFGARWRRIHPASFEKAVVFASE